ncbi:MAG: glycosyltransferase [Bacteroidaceae bacterium]|nr:glycosyltransferase [Bacteroidaceae bacterium]
MKKLLQINPVIRINTSTGRIMQEIGELARTHGWETYIAYSKGRDGVQPNDAKLIPVGNKWDVAWHGVMTRLFDRHGLASDNATRAFIEEIRRIQPDIIHIHNIHGYFLNYRILFDYLAKANIPVIWTVHDCWLYTGHCYYYSYAGCEKWKSQCEHCPQRRDFPASWWIDRSMQNFLDKKEAFAFMPKELLTIVPVSEWIHGEMKQSFLKDYSFQVIHNGINLENFRIYPTEEVKKQYGLEGKRIILGVASIWMEEKGWNDFMQLSELLSPEEVIVLVGVKEEQKKGLPKNIVPISRTENLRQLAELYAAAEAFVNPTWQDNYPTVNLEAIACGTPVVTYRTGGSIEVVTPDTGMIVEQGDVKGLIEAVRKIEKLTKNYFQPRCRAYAEAHFSKEDRYADYLKLYEVLRKR